MTRYLYRRMPGAPQPSTYETNTSVVMNWGEVEGNQHWNFCAAISDAIVRTAANPKR